MSTENALAERLRIAHDSAMRDVLGDADDLVLSSPIPFFMGGPSGVATHRGHLDGVVYATIDLISVYPEERPEPNRQGAYELMIATRREDAGASALIGSLGPYALDAVMNPGETMDIGPATPGGATVSAFLFQDYARFEVDGTACGLLLCLGITEDELALCLDGRRAEVEAALRKSGIWPFTDWLRQSVLAP